MSFSIHFSNRFFTIAIIHLLVGCSATQKIGQLPTLDNIKNRIDNITFPIQIPASADLNKLDAARFNSCMAPLSAKLKPGFIGMLHSINNQNHEAENQLFGQINELGDENILTDNQDLHPIIDHLFEKLLKIQFDKSTTNVGSKLADFNTNVLDKFNHDQELIKADTKEVVKRAKDYLIAYFTKGAAQTITQALQNNNEKQVLRSKAASLLKRKADDPELAKVFELLDPQLVKASDKMLKNASGFTARDGIQYSFPGILNENAHVTIDHSQIGADVIRIILEALRDTYAPLPMLASSTPAKKLQNAIAANNLGVDYISNIIEFSDNGKLLKVGDNGNSIELGQFSWHLDHHNPAIVEIINIDEERFQEIEAHARKAESFVASTVGQAIRGGSWGALNNEAVAKLVETAAGVIARYTTERAGWCLQAQLGMTKENKRSN